MPLSDGTTSRSFAVLRRFAQRPGPAERCELCGKPLAGEHAHLLEPATRRIACACDACAIVSSEGASGRYRRIPRRALFLADFCLTDAQWDSLLIPINIAFFYCSTPHERTIALYPSPAGATESLLDLNGWNEVVAQNPILATMESDVEALLVNRLRTGPSRVQDGEYYVAPIDECFKLVGLIRSHWRGLSGGTEVWQEIGQFFISLREKSQVPCTLTRSPIFPS